MKISAYVFLGAVLALLLLALVAADDPNQNEIKTDEANHQVADEKYYGGGGGWGGYGGGGGWSGGGGGRGWGGGGGGRGWGGGGEGHGWGGGGGRGWGGGGGCYHGQCCRRGGCGCCYSAQEALAYMQREARP